MIRIFSIRMEPPHRKRNFGIGQEQQTMTIGYEILGEPGRDNAVLVTVDSGQS